MGKDAAYSLATDRSNCSVLTQMLFQLCQRPGGKPQAQIGRARGGSLDDLFLYLSTVDPGPAGSLPVEQACQALGSETLHPFVGIRIMEVGDFSSLPDVVPSDQLPYEKAPPV